VDFFRSRGRSDRARAVQTQERMIDAAVKAIETRIAGIDVDETIRNAVSDPEPVGGEPNRGAMSGESPEASESIPGC